MAKEHGQMLINLYAKSNASSRAALTATIALIAVIGSYNWLIEPHVKYLEAAQRYADNVDSIGKKSKLIAGKLKIKQLEVNNLSKQVDATQGKIFTMATARQFFTNIELFAIQTHCTIKSLNQLSEQKGTENALSSTVEDITPYHTSIALIGRYDNIAQFLTKLLDRPNQIIVNPFAISVRQDDSGVLECSFVLTILVLNETPSKGADPNE